MVIKTLGTLANISFIYKDNLQEMIEMISDDLW